MLDLTPFGVATIAAVPLPEVRFICRDVDEVERWLERQSLTWEPVPPRPVAAHLGIKIVGNKYMPPGLLLIVEEGRTIGIVNMAKEEQPV